MPRMKLSPQFPGVRFPVKTTPVPPPETPMPSPIDKGVDLGTTVFLPVFFATGQYPNQRTNRQWFKCEAKLPVI